MIKICKSLTEGCWFNFLLGHTDILSSFDLKIHFKLGCKGQYQDSF